MKKKVSELEGKYSSEYDYSKIDSLALKSAF